MGYMDDTVHSLSVDGIEPSKENVANKTYPIAREVYWYTPSEREGVIKELVDFAISDNGQEIVEKEGLVLCDSADETLNGSDALVIATEWQEFRSPNFENIKQSLKCSINKKIDYLDLN